MEHAEACEETEDAPRPAIKMSMEVAHPAMADPTAKRKMALSRTTLLPKMSARRPLMGRMAVEVRVYADETQTKESVPSRSWMTVGRTVPTEAWRRAGQHEGMNQRG